MELLLGAVRSLDEAVLAEHAGRRYVASHVAALRAAAGLVTARSRTQSARGGRPVSVWLLLAQAAPDLAEWASYFAACGAKRTTGSAVSQREADDLMRDATTFVGVVVRRLQSRLDVTA
jgi:hypothetical protein